jgi:tRNA nucleotidyltransferase (CCA-adding enzyme)
VRQEIEKTMEQLTRPSRAFLLWKRSGAFAQLIPPLASASDVELSYPDYLAMPGPRGRPARRINRMAGLFLSVRAANVNRTLRALRFSNSDANWITALMEKWEQEAPKMEGELERGRLPAPEFIRRWVSRVGRTRAAPLLRLCFAVWDARAAAGMSTLASGLARPLYRRVVRTAYRDAVEVADLAIDGDDLRSIGISEGPVVGRILSGLLQGVLENPTLNTRETLLTLARQYADGNARG